MLEFVDESRQIALELVATFIREGSAGGDEEVERFIQGLKFELQDVPANIKLDPETFKFKFENDWDDDFPAFWAKYEDFPNPDPFGPDPVTIWHRGNDAIDELAEDRFLAPEFWVLKKCIEFEVQSEFEFDFDQNADAYHDEINMPIARSIRLKTDQNSVVFYTLTVKDIF
jgi:hypothetical protein